MILTTEKANQITERANKSLSISRQVIGEQFKVLNRIIFRDIMGLFVNGVGHLHNLPGTERADVIIVEVVAKLIPQWEAVQGTDYKMIGKTLGIKGSSEQIQLTLETFRKTIPIYRTLKDAIERL
jgi:hypothetical protein